MDYYFPLLGDGIMRVPEEWEREMFFEDDDDEDDEFGSRHAEIFGLFEPTRYPEPTKRRKIYPRVRSPIITRSITRKRAEDLVAEKCTICLEDAVDAYGCNLCKQLIGCKSCVMRWKETPQYFSNPRVGTCPLCRAIWSPSSTKPMHIINKQAEKKKEPKKKAAPKKKKKNNKKRNAFSSENEDVTRENDEEADELDTDEFSEEYTIEECDISGVTAAENFMQCKEYQHFETRFEFKIEGPLLKILEQDPELHKEAIRLLNKYEAAYIGFETDRLRQEEKKSPIEEVVQNVKKHFAKKEPKPLLYEPHTPCLFCTERPDIPFGCLSCQQLLGCQSCIMRWYWKGVFTSNPSSCPVCRHTWQFGPNTTSYLRLNALQRIADEVIEKKECEKKKKKSLLAILKL
ncbi:unnamed protein product [Caenorhabditis bovis]|uniref:RING-type domain-containing protein n=1 Tax=Caenorhabditis bovis TaxID=2654633 RepID=A0A8S1FB49_9PELO|nr:unnamed protein product [Caenorhabditis bovis]